MEAKTFYLHIADAQAEAYLMHGFFQSSTAKESPLHSHQHAEVHFIEEGQCKFIVEGMEFSAKAGDVVIIPAQQVHRTRLLDSETRHNAFLLNFPVNQLIHSSVPQPLLHELGRLIRDYHNYKDFSSIAPYVVFLCKDLWEKNLYLQPVENRPFLIREFFANRYNKDISLGDLAEELGLSTKQAARLVQRHMGNSFSKVLASYRIQAAKQLLATEPAPTLQQVAYMVGYSTYSGFWKAFKEVNGTTGSYNA